MLDARSFSASTALVVMGALLLLLTTPLCAADVCPMGEDGRMAGCEPLESGCCQTHGERTSPSPLQVSPPTLASWSLGPTQVPLAAPALPVAEELAPPAIVQGIGLYTFLAVFLI